MTTHNIDLETAEEIDWLREGRKTPPAGRSGAEAVREANMQAEKPLLQGIHVEGADQDEIDAAYQEFSDAVNMTLSDMRDWSDHDCSDEASINPEKVRNRVINLLDTPKEDWGDAEVSDADQVTDFIARMRGMPQGESTEDCPSDRDTSLMNWGYRPDGVSL